MASEKIKTNYSEYLSILNETKSSPSPIPLSKKNNKATSLAAEVDVQHPSIQKKISFLADVSTKHHSHFGFKLRAVHLCEKPIIRFEASGNPHRNDLEEIPLPERQVTTPHFHKFNKNGVCLAYKTSVLKDPAQAKAIVGDLTLGMAHFSQEAKLVAGQGLPELVEPSLSLALKDEADPLSGVIFP